MKNLITPLLLVSIIAGCAVNPRIEDLTHEQRQKAAKIKVIDGEPPQSYEVIKEIDGLSCSKNGYNYHASQSYDEAKEALRIKAAMIGADGVAFAFCQTNSDTDLRNNCWSSVKCVGDAVKFTDKEK